MQNEPKHHCFKAGSASDPRAALGRGNYVTSSLRRLDSLNSTLQGPTLHDPRCPRLLARAQGRWIPRVQSGEPGGHGPSSVCRGLLAQAAWAPGSPRPSLPQPLGRRAPEEPSGSHRAAWPESRPVPAGRNGSGFRCFMHRRQTRGFWVPGAVRPQAWAGQAVLLFSVHFGVQKSRQ